ncbi:13875_t:CDS:2 [Cetraspora pellucida]|uniref:13875_t:CDS:1 n=1 Tax=Cetraspora pellucida TaxID=1433469 RepID=A0ACA9NZZ0_9GLOM|nr:13875_t:CDS:2 [Cetraspora pellucida]
MQKIEIALNLLAVDHLLICLLYPSINEQQKLKDVLTLLEPIKAATKLLSATSYPTIEEFSQAMVAALIHQKLEEYWNIIDKSFIVSAIFDPCTKLKIFNRTEVTNVKNIVQEIMDQYKY